MTNKSRFGRVVTTGIQILIVNAFIAANLGAYYSCDQDQTVLALSKFEAPSLEGIDTELPTMNENQVLSPIESGLDTNFGFYTSLDGNTLAIGLLNYFDEYRGAVEIFEYQKDIWQRIKTLKSPNMQAYESFSVTALDGDTLLVGAWTQHQEIDPDLSLQHFAVDGYQMIASAEDSTVGYLLQRGTTPDS